MPRKRRSWIPDRFYHISCRGNRRDPLFCHFSDFQAFLHILQQVHEKYPFEIASYCLMTNHFHLQLRSKETDLSKIMSLINKRYANYYNTKYQLTGHVFEKRYFSKMIDEYDGMLDVSHYIHLNPLKANMVEKPENYPWSSFRLYKYPKSKPPVFMNMDCLLDCFEGELVERKRRYCESVTGACHAPSFVELVGSEI